jgi:hypothetical protein
VQRDPLSVYELFGIVDAEYRERAAVLRRYGIVVPMLTEEFEPLLIAPGRLPRSDDELKEYNDVAIGVSLYWFAWKSGRIALWASRESEEKDALRVAGHYIVEALRLAPNFYGLELDKPELPQPLRQRSLADLTGHVASTISLRRNPRLTAALSEETGRKPFVALLERLPAAVMVEWDEADEEIRFQSFGKRVVKHLEKELSVARKLAREGKLADDEASELGYDERDLMDFTQRESRAHRKNAMRELNRIIEEAGLGPNERQVFRMAISPMRNKQIAEITGRENNQIRQEKHRAFRKLDSHPEYATLAPFLIRTIRKMRPAG